MLYPNVNLQIVDVILLICSATCDNVPTNFVYFVENLHLSWGKS